MIISDFKEFINVIPAGEKRNAGISPMGNTPLNPLSRRDTIREIPQQVRNDNYLKHP